jgi:hypothetical protein
MEIEKVIYDMLTESTGTHMLDSGMSSGRHWQCNQLKSIDDFKNEPYITIEDEDTEYPYAIISVFHHLIDSLEYLENETDELNLWLDDINRQSTLEYVSEYMNEQYANEGMFKVSHTNTYNGDCNLSQTIQFVSVGDTYDCNIIALSIHNGADVRGGYTDYKLFEADIDSLYSWYMEEEQIEEHIEYLKAG